MRIGAQLYTARSLCQTPEGIAETLKRTADIGYTTVQISGLCDVPAAWLREELDKNGLKCVLTHIPVPRLTGELEAVVRDHDILGCDRVGLGYWGFTEENGMTLERWLALFPPVAHGLHEKGKYFMYHNHAGEFRRIHGRTVMEALMEAVPPEEMGFTLDTYWVQVGGGDPAQWLERLSGRIPCIHLKDCGYGQRMEALGEGNLNFDRILEKAEAGGTEFLLVEQDDCHGEDPMECLRRSYRYLKARGLN